MHGCWFLGLIFGTVAFIPWTIALLSYNPESARNKGIQQAPAFFAVVFFLIYWPGLWIFWGGYVSLASRL
jgi:hypothetical protein